MVNNKKSPVKDLDRIDRNILNELQIDGRISNVELSKRVGLSPTPCLERVKRLEKQGYINGYTALVNPHFWAHPCWYLSRSPSTGTLRKSSISLIAPCSFWMIFRSATWYRAISIIC